MIYNNGNLMVSMLTEMINKTTKIRNFRDQDLNFPTIFNQVNDK